MDEQPQSINTAKERATAASFCSLVNCPSIRILLAPEEESFFNFEPGVYGKKLCQFSIDKKLQSLSWLCPCIQYTFIFTLNLIHSGFSLLSTLFLTQKAINKEMPVMINTCKIQGEG